MPRRLLGRRSARALRARTVVGLPWRFVAAWLLLALTFSVQVSGCSVIGYFVGGSIDRGLPPKLHSSGVIDVIQLKPGATVVAHMKDGSSVGGRYLGVSTRSDTARYAAWSDTTTLDFRVPQIGEEVSVRLRAAGARHQGAFAGFGPRVVHLREGTRVSTLRLDEVEEFVDATQTRITRTQLLRAAARAPVHGLIRLRASERYIAPLSATDGAPTTKNGDEVTVDVLADDVETLEVGEPGSGFRSVFVIVGLATDVFLIAGLTSYSGCEGADVEYAGTPARVDPDTLWWLASPVRATLAAAD